MRRIAAGAALVLVLLLTACAGLPTSGDVYPGNTLSDVADNQGVVFVPDRPQTGATPQQIVQGFLRAGSGPQGNWATAQEFLTSDEAQSWSPRSSVTIDRLADREVVSASESGDTASVLYSLTPTGAVDNKGAYRPEASGPTELSFELARQSDGQWRITQAPDGIVLFEEEFRSVFISATLPYFDPDWVYLVPDVRWFPRVNVATTVAQALVNGVPSPWLATSVRSAFTSDVRLATVATPVVDGVAEIDLTSAALSLDAVTLGRMQAQLEVALRSVDVSAVQMTVGGSPLQSRAEVGRSTRVDSRPLVMLADSGLGFLDGESVEPLGALSSAVDELGAIDVATSPDRAYAAVRTAQGAVVRASAEGTTTVLDSRPGLIAPTIDTKGAIWSVPAESPGAVTVYPTDAVEFEVTGAWPEATRISAMQVSRDGTRMAAVVSAHGHTELWVAGILRSAERIELGEPYVLATTVDDGYALAWLDDMTVGMLEHTAAGEPRLREQPVGGPGTDYTVPAGVTSIAGGNATARLLADTGVLYSRQAASWQQVATDVRVLAVQQGTLP